MPKAPPLLLALAVAAAGCAGGRAVPSPADTVRAYAAAIRAGDAARVHALLDEETRARLTVEEARALLAENERPLEADAAAAERALPRLEARATLPLGGGETVVLRLEEGEYLLEGGVLDLVSLSTPDQAVAALRRALARGSFTALLRVLARSTRTDVATAVERLLEETADPLALDVRVTGDTATIALPSGRVLHLVHEEGEWHLVDLP